MRHLYVVVIVNRSRHFHCISEKLGHVHTNSVLILEQNLNGGLHQLVSIPWSSTRYLCSRDHWILTVWRGTRCDCPKIYTSMWPVCPFPSDGSIISEHQEGHVLFSIPRSLTLSTRTSQLPLLFGLDAWQKASLHRGWSGLILCMMWEQANGPSSKWKSYLGDRIILFTISRWLV